MLGIVFACVERSVRVLFDMLVVGNLLYSDRMVMRRSSRTSRFAAGIYKKLAVGFSRKLFKNLEIIVEIIIDNNDAVVLFKLGF